MIKNQQLLSFYTLFKEQKDSVSVFSLMGNRNETFRFQG